jgi:hypothetical protein
MSLSKSKLAASLRLIAIIYVVASFSVLILGHLQVTSFEGGSTALFIGNYVTLICREILIVLAAFALAKLVERS